MKIPDEAIEFLSIEKFIDEEIPEEERLDFADTWRVKFKIDNHVVEYQVTEEDHGEVEIYIDGKNTYNEEGLFNKLPELLPSLKMTDGSDIFERLGDKVNAAIDKYQEEFGG